MSAKRYFSLPEGAKMEVSFRVYVSKDCVAFLSLLSPPHFLLWQLDIHKSPNFKGYTALLGENTDSTGLGDLHEGFDLGWEPRHHSSATTTSNDEGDKHESRSTPRNDGVMTGANVWPDNLPGFREAVLDY